MSAQAALGANGFGKKKMFCNGMEKFIDSCVVLKQGSHVIPGAIC